MFIYNKNNEIDDFTENNFNWRDISRYQYLSESFIEKFQDKVDWFYITEYQVISEPFIEKFYNYINLDNLFIYNKLIDKQIIFNILDL